MSTLFGNVLFHLMALHAATHIQLFALFFLRHLCTKPPNGYCACSSLLLQAMGQMKIFHTPACVTNKALTLKISKLIVLLIEKSLIFPIIQIKSIMVVKMKKKRSCQ